MVCIRNWKLLSWEGAHIEALPKALPRPVGWISALLFGRNDSFLFLPFIPSSLRFMFSCGSCTSLDPDSHGNKESHSLLDWARFPSTEWSLLTPFPSFWSGSRQHFRPDGLHKSRILCPWLSEAFLLLSHAGWFFPTAYSPCSSCFSHWIALPSLGTATYHTLVYFALYTDFEPEITYPPGNKHKSPQEKEWSSSKVPW